MELGPLQNLNAGFGLKYISLRHVHAQELDFLYFLPLFISLPCLIVNMLF